MTNTDSSGHFPVKLSCHGCNLEFEIAVNVIGARAPECGDAIMCKGCGHIMIFNESLELRCPTEAEDNQIRAIHFMYRLFNCIERGESDGKTKH